MELPVLKVRRELLVQMDPQVHRALLGRMVEMERKATQALMELPVFKVCRVILVLMDPQVHKAPRD